MSKFVVRRMVSSARSQVSHLAYEPFFVLAVSQCVSLCECQLADPVPSLSHSVLPHSPLLLQSLRSISSACATSMIVRYSHSQHRFRVCSTRCTRIKKLGVRQTTSTHINTAKATFTLQPHPLTVSSSCVLSPSLLPRTLQMSLSSPSLRVSM